MIIVSMAAQIDNSAVNPNLLKKTSHVLAVPAIPGSNVNPQLPVSTFTSQP
jgi:hypothetical protein